MTTMAMVGIITLTDIDGTGLAATARPAFP
jgi:hypothetical protein